MIQPSLSVPDDPGGLSAIVLAGGEGRRLAALTRALYGHDLPKQFAVIHGNQSLLQSTVQRIRPLVPPARTTVVVNHEYAGLARSQLAADPGIDLVAQPANRDTAPGILLPLARIMRRRPDSTVVVLPSDHYIEHELPVRWAIARAARCASLCPHTLTLLGIQPDRAETEYGWIVPGPSVQATTAADVYEVSSFVEKPSALGADRLLRQGALWNSFLLVGRAQHFWDLARRFLPDSYERFEAYRVALGTPHEHAVLAEVYADLPAANFSRAVLEPAAAELRVLPLVGSGWSDWGQPGRVLASLAGTPRHAELMRALHSPQREDTLSTAVV